MALGENVLGLLKLKIMRGINLPVHDAHHSDPYVVVEMGEQVSSLSLLSLSLPPYLSL